MLLLYFLPAPVSRRGGGDWRCGQLTGLLRDQRVRRRAGRLCAGRRGRGFAGQRRGTFALHPRCVHHSDTHTAHRKTTTESVINPTQHLDALHRSGNPLNHYINLCVARYKPAWVIIFESKNRSGEVQRISGTYIQNIVIYYRCQM